MLAAGAAPMFIPAASALAATPGAGGHKIRIGLIGCGGRGQWIMPRFLEHGGYDIVAGADYFQDRLDSFSEKFGVPAAKCYRGLDGYRRLIDGGGVDAVVIKSPPWFHPEQARYAVEAGLHVYLAKPIAVDVAGSRHVGESGEMARRKGLTFLVDFQTRADPIFQEALARVHAGALGKLSFGQSMYHAQDPFGNAAKVLGPDPRDPERRLRVWGVDRVLSGDIITEQNIHTLDVMSWIMNTPPVSAMGRCNQKIRPWGDCHDHFSLVYAYPNHVDVSFTSRQFAAHGTRPEGIWNRMFGEDGVLETEYAGPVIIRGGAESFYRGGDTAGLYHSGAVANVKAFHDQIRAGDAANITVEPSVRSNLVTILGRMAAYQQREVTWAEMLASNESLSFPLDLPGA